MSASIIYCGKCDIYLSGKKDEENSVFCPKAGTFITDDGDGREDCFESRIKVK